MNKPSKLLNKPQESELPSLKERLFFILVLSSLGQSGGGIVPQLPSPPLHINVSVKALPKYERGAHVPVVIIAVEGVNLQRLFKEEKRSIKIELYGTY